MKRIQAYLLIFCCVMSSILGIECPLQKIFRQQNECVSICCTYGVCISGSPIFSIGNSATKEVFTKIVAELPLKPFALWDKKGCKDYLPPPLRNQRIRWHLFLCILRN